MNELEFQQKLEKLQITHYGLRLFGVFFNVLDLPGIFGFVLGSALCPVPSARAAVGAIAGLLYLGAQIYLATKGYTVSKIILGRKVLNRDTLEKANPVIVMIRPILAHSWMFCMIGLAFVFAAMGAAFASIFHRSENTVYDKAYNDAVTASMTVGSMGIFSNIFFRYPKITWLHDTICQTIVVSVPHAQMKAEVFSKEAPVKTIEHKFPKQEKKEAA